MPLQRLVNYPLDNNFRFYCSEAPLLSNLCQDVTIPSLTIGGSDTPNRFVDYREPGEKIQFSELDVGFSYDEYMDVYAEIWSWMSRMCGPPGMSQYKESERKVVLADIDIILLDNKLKQSRKFTFYDAWPSNIGAISYDVASESTAVKGIVTFEYKAMDITPWDKDLTNLGDFAYNH